MFKGFVCPVTGVETETERCMECALTGSRECPYPYPVLKGIAESNAPRGHVGWSATTILGCARQARLKGLVDYYLDPSEAFWAFRGHLAHLVVAEFARLNKSAIVEMRFGATLIVNDNPVLVSGKPDVVHPEQGHLVDFKTTKKVPNGYYVYTCKDCDQIMQEGKWKLRRGCRKTCPRCGSVHEPAEVQRALTVEPPRPYDSHIGQLSIYRWLLAQHSIEVTTAEVIYFNMDELRRVDVDLWDLEQTESVIKQKLAALEAEDLPEPLVNSWRCKYCDVKAACDALQAGAALLDLTDQNDEDKEPFILDLDQMEETKSEPEPFVILE